MTSRNFSTLPALIFGTALAVTLSACSTGAPSVCTGGITALAFRASPAVYSTFQKDLNAIRADSEFTRRAKDPSNYDVHVSETADEFIFTFAMRPVMGERILDGRAVYVVDKSDGAVTIRSML